MKRVLLSMGLLTLGLMATDFSSMTTEELIALRGTVAVEDQADFRAEMQSRVANMTPEERAAFTASRQAAQGAGGGAVTPPTFSDIDKDGDGKITQEELDAMQADRQAANSEAGKLLLNSDSAPTLADLDTNGDGVVDESEFLAHQSEQMATHPSQGGGMGQQLHDGSGAGSMMQSIGAKGHGGMGRNQ